MGRHRATRVRRAHANWEQGLNRLVAALDHLGENTKYSSNTYDMADQASASGLHAAGGMSPFGGALNPAGG